jgi:acyl-[acyl-carrier-protein]-phospholipid O-acyltransferase/long-chain-fatty-acid--[acyl-carrier-protein] ligase
LPGLNYTVFGLACFWLAAALIQMNVLVHAPETYNLSNTQTAIIMSLIAVGIGFGCWVAGMLAKDRVEVGMAPLGGLGLSICMTIFALFEMGLTAFIVILSIAAFFSGFFKVPLGAWIQERVEGRKLGNILAYTNMITFLFILISAGIFAACMKFGNTYTVFAVIAIVGWIMTFVTAFKVPAMLVRFIADSLAKIYFRYEVEGKENIPKRSGALLVANHISLMDFLMIVATIPRQVRFVVAKDVYDFWAWSWLTKRMNLIPIATKGGPERLKAFNEACQREINAGHVVVIYPEGQISRIGHLLEFKKGVEHIARGIDAPIIPVHMEGTEGTFFSYEIGSSNPIKALKGFRKRIHVSIGTPTDPSSKAFHLRQSVIEMSAQSIEKRFADEHTLGLFLKNTAKEMGDLTCTHFEDGGVITVKELALHALKWKSVWMKKSVHKIGILLPKNRENMLANASLVLAGKISININPSFEDDQLKAIVLESEVVLCEEAQRSKLESLGAECLLISDFLKELENEKDVSSVPNHINKIGHGKEIKTTDIATIIYQYDEENNIVRVPLSHMNVMAGIKGLLLVNKFEGGAKMLGLMPFHTSNGYILDLCMSTFIGVQNFHYDPMKGPEAIAAKMKAEQVELFVGNRALIESVDAIDHKVWASVKTLISGEEKLNEELRTRLKETYDLEVRESLHALRSGTLIALNTPDYVVQGVVGRPLVQVGSHEASLGRPIPGLAIRTVEENDFDHVLDEDQVGRILIKGAAVTPLLDPSFYYKGWVDTGRRGFIDEAGFVHLSE